MYPKFTANLQNGKREFDLDVEVAASGFSKDDRKHLDDVRFQLSLSEGHLTDESLVEDAQYMAELAAHDRENGVDGEEEEEYSDEEERSGEEEEEDDEVEGDVVAPPPTRNLHQTEEDKEREVLASISANSTTVLEGETDRFGNLRIAEPAVDESDEEEEDSEEDSEEEDSEEEDSDVGSVAPSQAPRMRPKRQTRDVESIVTAKLNRQHKSSERKHHGKKTASSNVLGRQKGSKKKTSHNAAIKEGKKGNAFF